MKMTNRDLWRCYDVANLRYFHNKLQRDIPLRFAKLPNGMLGKTYVCTHGIAQAIEISERLKSNEVHAIMTLLHEMVHVEKPRYKGHGWRFDRRMKKLAQDGAFDGLW